MKKSLLVCALFSQPLAGLSFTDVASKYYVEAALGTSMMHSRAKLWSNFKGPGSIDGLTPTLAGGPIYSWGMDDGTLNTNDGAPGFAGSASIGYDCRLPRSAFLWGAFFGGGGTGAHCSVPYYGSILTAAGGGQIVGRNIRASVYLSDGGFFTLGGRFGVAMGPALFFFRLGWAPHRIQCKIQRMGTTATASGYDTAVQKKAISSWISTLLLGVGADLNLTKNLILGFLIEGHIGGQKDFQFPTGIFTNGEGYDTPRIRAKPFLTQYLITMKYALPVCHR